jgi:hypothetical protein
MEIDAAKARLPVLVRVYHLDGTFDTMPVTSWSTPATLKELVAEKRGIQDAEAFALYEMTPEGEERFLEPEERILDLVAYWQRLFEEEKQKASSQRGKGRAGLGWLWPPPPPPRILHRLPPPAPPPPPPLAER